VNYRVGVESADVDVVNSRVEFDVNGGVDDLKFLSATTTRLSTA
jgi:hypothetical protein